MLKEKFLEYFKSERNYSQLTVDSYGTDLDEFEEFFESLHESITWETVDETVVREWIIYLLDEKKLENSSVNRKLSALRSFFRYLLKIGAVPKDPMLRIVGPKKKKVLPVFIREKEMDELFEMLEADKSYEGILNKTVILMLYLTGMRRAELLSLADRDIDFVNKQIKVTGKRDKQRIIPFGKELEDCLHEYMNARSEQFDRGFERLFIGTKGKPLTETGVENIVKENLSKKSTCAAAHIRNSHAEQQCRPSVNPETLGTRQSEHNSDLYTCFI